WPPELRLHLPARRALRRRAAGLRPWRGRLRPRTGQSADAGAASLARCCKGRQLRIKEQKMRITNGATAMAGRAGKGRAGVVVAGGTGAFVLASGGIATASPLPAHVTVHGAASGHSAGHLNQHGRTPSAGNGKPHAPAPGQGGWNRVATSPAARARPARATAS